MPELKSNPERIEHLCSLLKVGDVDTRWKAARSLADFGDAALHPLLARIYDDDDNVRLLAIWALGRMGNQMATEPISRSLNDENIMVQMACEGAMTRLMR